MTEPASRLKVSKILNKLTPNVYYQSPEKFKMEYPAIVYELNRWNDLYANNHRYKKTDEYLVTVIERNPDSSIVAALRDIPYCRLDRTYKSDNLYHTVFVIKI